MCGFMRPPGLPKRMAGSNSFIARIAVTWACFNSDSERYSMHCAKDYAFPSVSFYPWTRLQRHQWRTDFLYGSKSWAVDCTPSVGFGVARTGMASAQRPALQLPPRRAAQDAPKYQRSRAPKAV